VIGRATARQRPPVVELVAVGVPGPQGRDPIAGWSSLGTPPSPSSYAAMQQGC